MFLIISLHQTLTNYYKLFQDTSTIMKTLQDDFPGCAYRGWKWNGYSYNSKESLDSTSTFIIYFLHIPFFFLLITLIILYRYHNCVLSMSQPQRSSFPSLLYDHISSEIIKEVTSIIKCPCHSNICEICQIFWYARHHE